jgi:hypothetical protein
MKTDTTLIIDIETMDAPPASIQEAEKFVKPHPGTKDQDKKDKQVATKKAKLQESAALLDSSPVPIIGVIAGGKTLQFFVWDKDSPVDFDIPGVAILPVKSEHDLLLCFKWFLEGQAWPTIVGHNIEKRYNGTGFDLPHLRFRYAYHGIALPVPMDPFHTRTVDLMELYFRSSTTKKDVFVSLEEMAARLGIADQPFPIQGKDVPAMWAAGDVEACLLKNYFDLLLTQQVFSRLAPAF